MRGGRFVRRAAWPRWFSAAPGRLVDLGAVHQAVAARPHAVIRLRQIGHDKAAAIVGDHALMYRTEIAGFRDHPDAGLVFAAAREL